MKLKHNKLRNTSILFELLVRQITTDTLNNRDSKAVDIIKKHYNNNEIAKEYKIYKTLSENKNLSEGKANILLNIAIDSYKKINKSLLSKQKYDLISAIKSNYNINEFFKANVDNYKTLASIYMLFEGTASDKVDPGSEAKYRFSIMESICAPKENLEKNEILEQYKSMDKGSKAVVYKLLINKFNEKYSDLDDNQKTLLKEYISNISTANSLREHINNEIYKVRAEFNSYLKTQENTARKVKINEVLNFTEIIPDNKQVCEKDINNLLYYYELLKEFKK